MLVTDAAARKLACAKNPSGKEITSMCLGSECMAWVWREETWQCPTCGVRYAGIDLANTCHGRLALIYREGGCGWIQG